jgi:hypothetical protein
MRISREEREGCEGKSFSPFGSSYDPDTFFGHKECNQETKPKFAVLLGNCGF